MAATRRSATLPPHTHRRAIHRWAIRRPGYRPGTPARLPAAGLPAPGYGWQPGYPHRLARGIRPARVSAARLRRTAAAGPPDLGAGDHPVAAVEPERHLQRRGRLHPGQPQSHAGTDGRRRRDHADLLTLVAVLGPLAAASRLRTSPARANSPGATSGPGRSSGGLSGAGQVAVRHPADRHAHGRRRPRGVRLDNRHRRNVGQDSRTAARVDRPGRAGVAGLIAALSAAVGVIVGVIAAARQRRGRGHPRLSAGADVDRGAGLSVHRAVVRARADRAGTTAGHRCDRRDRSRWCATASGECSASGC